MKSKFKYYSIFNNEFYYWFHLWLSYLQKELTPEQTQENIMLMNVLAGDIIGDLQGILANIKSAENVHRGQQKKLEKILVTALKTMNLGKYILL